MLSAWFWCLLRSPWSTARAASPVVKEPYDLMYRGTKCECGYDVPMLKPKRAGFDELNSDEAMQDMNFFLICWNCKSIVQVYVGGVPMMEIAS